MWCSYSISKPKLCRHALLCNNFMTKTLRFCGWSPKKMRDLSTSRKEEYHRSTRSATKISRSQLPPNSLMDSWSVTPKAKSSSTIPIATWSGGGKLTREKSNSCSSIGRIGWFFRWEQRAGLPRCPRGTLHWSNRERWLCLGGSRSTICGWHRRAIYWLLGSWSRSSWQFGITRLWSYSKCCRCRVRSLLFSAHRNWIWS